MPVRNIIFDFGGVVCNIDISRTKAAFAFLGLRKFDDAYSFTEKETFLGNFELGLITPEQFHATMKSHFERPVTDAEIDHAWNALLLDIPPDRITLLKSLRTKYRLFLLSNTNPIHYKKYLTDLQTVHGCRDFSDLFEKIYLSYQIRLRKPFRETFEFVLGDASLTGDETLFIDDSLPHVLGARKAGLLAYHLLPGEDIRMLFSPEMQFLRAL